MPIASTSGCDFDLGSQPLLPSEPEVLATGLSSTNVFLLQPSLANTLQKVNTTIGVKIRLSRGLEHVTVTDTESPPSRCISAGCDMLLRGPRSGSSCVKSSRSPLSRQGHAVRAHPSRSAVRLGSADSRDAATDPSRNWVRLVRREVADLVDFCGFTTCDAVRSVESQCLFLLVNLLSL